MVDGSVVVVENVFSKLSHARHEHHGDLSPGARLKLVYGAVTEVATPVLFGVAIIILVFLPLMTLEGMEGIGNYAVRLGWNDGHSSGLYTWETLERLCRARPESAYEPEKSSD